MMVKFRLHYREQIERITEKSRVLTMILFPVPWRSWLMDKINCNPLTERIFQLRQI